MAFSRNILSPSSAHFDLKLNTSVAEGLAKAVSVMAGCDAHPYPSSINKAEFAETIRLVRRQLSPSSWIINYLFERCGEIITGECGEESDVPKQKPF
ncbi:MAG TPA: hypothetical protein VGD64_02470 [Acidisarcina sp.]